MRKIPKPSPPSPHKKKKKKKEELKKKKGVDTAEKQCHPWKPEMGVLITR